MNVKAQDTSINDQEPIIKLEGITKVFDGQIAVDDVSLDIYPGEFFSLLGGSGSGKTNLLRMLAGFESVTAGKIFIDGQEVADNPPYERPVNMMFQSYALFPHMTVEQNIAFGLKQEKMPRRHIAEEVEKILTMVEMAHLAKRKPHQLSGGQRQRVALARCLAKKPKVILLDEPLSALDKKLREQMQFELVDIQESIGITFVMVTHDQAEAMTMSTRIGVMNKGYLEQVGTPNEVYEFPHNLFTAEFIGSTNTFECTVTENDDAHTQIHSEDTNCEFAVERKLDVAPEQTLWCAIRPEKIEISKEPPENLEPGKMTNCTQGVVEDIAYLGGLSTYHVRLARGKLIKAMDFNIERKSDHPTWDDVVYLSWESENIMVLTS